MNRLHQFFVGTLEWLKDNFKWNLTIVIFYYLMVVLPHEVVGQFLSSHLEVPLGRIRYNELILGLSIIGGLGYGYLFKMGIDGFPERLNSALLYAGITLFLIIGAVNYLMVGNIEMMHLVQYALLVLLLSPLLNSFAQVFFFSVLLGALDEAYQYWILTPTTNYYDFNDLVINSLGAGLGMILLFANGAGYPNKPKSWHTSPVAITALFSTIVLGGYASLEILSVYPSSQLVPSPIQLIRSPQESLWTIIAPDVKFHVLRPLSGLLVGLLLFLFYQKMDDLTKSNHCYTQISSFKIV